MFRTLWHTISTELIASAAFAVIALLLYFAGVTSVPRAFVCVAGAALCVIIWRLRYAR